MRDTRPDALKKKQDDQTKMQRSARKFAKWAATDEGKRALAISAEFSAKWKAELEELQKGK
jgi:hypothetical protein